MGTVIPLHRIPDQPVLPCALHLFTGDVLVPQPAFRIAGDALEHARYELVRTGCDYAAIALVDSAIRVQGVPNITRDPLPR